MKGKKTKTFFAKESGLQRVPAAATGSAKAVKPTKIKSYKVPQTSAFRKLK
jgi:hypothetical protein